MTADQPRDAVRVETTRDFTGQPSQPTPLPPETPFALASTPASPEIDVDRLDEWRWTGLLGSEGRPGHAGAGDGWIHVHPDGTRWVHPEKECPIAAAYREQATEEQP